MKQILLTIIILCIGTVLFAQNLDNVAILDLEPKGLSTIEAEILSGKLRQATVDSRLFEVVDRGNMDAILEEQSVQLSGCISGECVVQVGQLLGVVKIISGTVGKFGSLYTISLTLTDIESGKIEKQSGYELQGEVEYLLTFGITNAYKKLMGLSYQNPQIVIGNVDNTTNTTAAQQTVNGMGSLIIESDPGGAQITLDGMNMGTTPFRIEQIPSGSKYLQLTLVGYDDHKNYINIQAYQENKITQILKWKDKAEMVFVKGGSFQMGSNNGDLDEKPIHSVIVSDFYISKSEVSQALYQEVMGKNPSRFKGNNRPVEMVSWYDAVKFCNELSR
ncbi:MAG: SUMF1/EgtB/PvdO family nonheme iron enzyme, partial [Candidatus Marinimicrobia bacterium]|nr:SUMF1/EgtB/PvdO family nonheme iron enzyme [Candidatus Neomarinimicrobiota bacterium]